MPMDNTLNVSELLKRLGVVGDSQASASLLDQIRMVMNIADLSRLVPPLVGPIAAGSVTSTSDPITICKFNLNARSQGGLQLISIISSTDLPLVKNYFIWITDVNPFGALTPGPFENLSFGQVAESVLSVAPIGANVAPASAVLTTGRYLHLFGQNIWLGPGQFLNVESETMDTEEKLTFTWAEYTGGLNP